MRAMTRYADGRSGLVEAGAPKDLAAQRSPTADYGEYKILGQLPSHVTRQTRRPGN
jgi:hypothetical protein